MDFDRHLIVRHNDIPIFGTFEYMRYIAMGGKWFGARDEGMREYSPTILNAEIKSSSNSATPKLLGSRSKVISTEPRKIWNIIVPLEPYLKPRPRSLCRQSFHYGLRECLGYARSVCCFFCGRGKSRPCRGRKTSHHLCSFLARFQLFVSCMEYHGMYCNSDVYSITIIWMIALHCLNV